MSCDRDKQDGTEARAIVHLGDAEVVDGVIVHVREPGPWTHAALTTAAIVVAAGSVVIGAAVVATRYRARAATLDR